MARPMTDLLTTSEAAAMLGISTDRVSVMCQNGLLAPAWKEMGETRRLSWFIDKAAVEAEAERRKAEPDRKRWRYAHEQPEREIKIRFKPSPLQLGVSDKYECMVPGGWFQHKPQPKEGKRKAYCRNCKAKSCVHHHGQTPRDVLRGARQKYPREEYVSE